MPRERSHSSTHGPRSKRRPSMALDVASLVLTVVIATVVPVVNGAGVGLVLVTLGIGVLAGAAAALTSGRWFFPAVFGMLLLGVVLGGLLDLLVRTTFITWFFAVLIGAFLGALLFRKQRTVRGPVVLTAADGTRRAVTISSGLEASELEPTPAGVGSAVRALDGTEHTVVSVLHGPARLDVVGDARSAVLVLQSDDHEDHRTHWHHVTSPHEADREEPEVEVAVAGVTGHFRQHQTTTAENALVAVEHFLTTGDRTPRLEWHGGRDVVAMRAPLGES